MPSGGAFTADPAPPFGDAELAALLAAIGGFEARPRVAVGVSGGPDSMALVLLVDRWARRRGGEAVGLTVDHGLRPESGAEAQLVAGWLARRGIAHSILRWHGKKPMSGIQEAARTARYELLASWCRAHGFLHLLTAHHREDQAETYLIRRRAGSGTDGLAAMSVLRELAGCRLVRPLLSVPPARLAAVLTAAGQPFLTDPSNLNPIFERARLRLPSIVPRRGVAAHPEPMNVSSALDAGSGPAAHRGMTTEEALAESGAFGALRIAREKALDRLIGRAVALHPAGFAVLDRNLLMAAADDNAERLLARVAACIGGTHYPPRRARVARLRAGLYECAPRARTLAGCRFVPWRGRILVLREPAAAAPPACLAPGGEILWDRRFAASLAPEAGSAFHLGSLGASGAALPGRAAVDLPALVDPVLPAFWDDVGLAAVPHLFYRRAGVGVLPVLSFRPVNSLVRAGFTVV